MCGFVGSAVTPGTLLVTDDWSAYGSLRARGYDHHAIAECGDPEIAEEFLPISHLVFSNLKTVDAATIVEALERKKIPYRLAEGGTEILVPEDRADATRLDIMSEELPLKGTAGFAAEQCAVTRISRMHGNRDVTVKIFGQHRGKTAKLGDFPLERRIIPHLLTKPGRP